MILGALGTPRRAQARGGGVVVLHEGESDELRFSWWIGADDRWHQMSTSITARQSLVRDVPIVSTTIRVPSGDAVANSYVCVQGPRELVVLDLDNRSKVPFAAALVVSGPGLQQVTLDGSVLRCGSLPVAFLPREPQRSASAVDESALFDVVARGDAATEFSIGASERAVALLFPVTHSTSLRCSAFLGGSSPLAFVGSPVLSALPGVHDVANGWDSQLGRTPGLRNVSFEQSIRPVLCTLMLEADHQASLNSSPTLQRAALAISLDRLGLSAEAGRLLADVADRQGRRGAFDDVATTIRMVHALCQHAVLSHDAVFATSVSPVVAGAIEFVLRNADGAQKPSVGPFVGEFFRVARDPRASKQAQKTLRIGVLDPLPEPPVPPMSAGADFVPDGIARLHNAVESWFASISSFNGSECDVMGVLGSEPGSNVEARNLATPWGRLSLAARWHGERSALLWECVSTHDDQDPNATVLRVGDWSGRGATGEALLPKVPPASAQNLRERVRGDGS